MWEMVRSLRDTGVTIILTTHYIEEAEQMADRIGVINKGEIILVEDKAVLMEKLGKKAADPATSASARDASPTRSRTTISSSRATATSSSTPSMPRASEPKIADLLRELAELGIDFNDLQTRESSLEDIFVSLVSGRS